MSTTFKILKRAVAFEDALALVAAGHARVVGGALVPTAGGADPEADPLYPPVPESVDELGAEELEALEASLVEQLDAVTGSPTEYVSEARSAASVLEQTSAAVDALERVRARLEQLEPEVSGDELAAQMAALAERAQLADEPEAEEEAEEQPEEPAEEAAAAEVEAAEAEAVVASVETRRRVSPARGRQAIPQAEPAAELVPLVAAAGAQDLPLGSEFETMRDLATAMIRRRNQYGMIPDGLSSKEPIARADWSHLYPAERKLGKDEEVNESLIRAATDMKSARTELRRRRENGLTAAGGLCAPVQPYYQLQMLAVADRPVRASLAAFNAERGGIRYARPAGLGSISTGVGVVTAANDKLGGTSATKTCQVIDCPPFSETDVDTIFHCLQFGNLGARVFPELVAQWNGLSLAAQARLAESRLLTAIGAASVKATAGTLGLGASSSVLGQLLAAVNGVRSRNRMDPESVLRVLLPDWIIDVMISDVIRGQFQRFETDEDKLVAFLRTLDVEPTFYLDSASGKGQIFGAQPDGGALVEFPSSAIGYLFPEGSFLFVDQGTLELGLVRDSVLNKTNDYQIFGETFENVAFVGIESLEITFSVCASGTVTLPRAVNCPITNTGS